MLEVKLCADRDNGVRSSSLLFSPSPATSFRDERRNREEGGRGEEKKLSACNLSVLDRSGWSSFIAGDDPFCPILAYTARFNPLPTTASETTSLAKTGGPFYSAIAW
jgi:hypothetical protein